MEESETSWSFFVFLIGLIYLDLFDKTMFEFIIYSFVLLLLFIYF